jgi:crotonobetainyl-CoA:carnitine CoA-transferase CaiB-like acyl-CoA transferase
MADLTAGFLLATGVLAALVRARETGVGELVDVSLLAAALAVQLQDLVWLEGELDAGARPATRIQLESRADEIADGVAMNPYYRCFEASDGFVAVACLNLAQRRSFLALFGLDDPTIDAPDVEPGDRTVLATKMGLTATIAGAFSSETAATWLERLASAGVPSTCVQQREGVRSDPQVVAEGLVGGVTQPGLGEIDLLAPFIRAGGQAMRPSAAPALGADTEAVLAELA